MVHLNTRQVHLQVGHTFQGSRCCSPVSVGKSHHYHRDSLHRNQNERILFQSRPRDKFQKLVRTQNLSLIKQIRKTVICYCPVFYFLNFFCFYNLHFRGSTYVGLSRHACQYRMLHYKQVSKCHARIPPQKRTEQEHHTLFLYALQTGTTL